MAWRLQNTRLPVLLKGLLHADDALQAAALGVAGLIVSNHGGRALDTAPALPRIAQALAGLARALLVAGGSRRGTDGDGPDRLPHAGRHRARGAVAGLTQRPG